MEIAGRVQNGVIVLEEGVVLPEGADVRVVCSAGPVIHVSRNRKRVQLPLVKSDRPGTLELTSERIAEILEAEDIESLKGQWDVPS
ncbi:MAG TPA: hypothetical protein VMM76_18020 [Pirellulaceae bacterium]|nr:hypothetical protein [Pirellulaceae bacterium]